MTSITAGLTELHALLTQLEAVRKELKQGPLQVRAREKIVAARQAEVNEQREKLTNLRKAADQKSLQLKSNEAKIQELKAKLNAAASNREFDIIKSQIDADTMANSVLEDEILEALDHVDEAQQNIQEYEDSLAAAEAEVNRHREIVDEARPGLENQLAELESQIQVAQEVIPSSVRTEFKRLVSAHGAGALASIESRACMSCHSVISSQDLVKLNVGTQPTFCRNCGRLLYSSK